MGLNVRETALHYYEKKTEGNYKSVEVSFDKCGISKFYYQSSIFFSFILKNIFMSEKQIFFVKAVVWYYNIVILWYQIWENVENCYIRPNLCVENIGS